MEKESSLANLFFWKANLIGPFQWHTTGQLRRGGVGGRRGLLNKRRPKCLKTHGLGRIFHWPLPFVVSKC